jgi:hypothetical protein
MASVSDVFGEESSDEEFVELLGTFVAATRPVARVFRDHTNPIEDYSDEDFRVRLRLDKASVLQLLSRVQDRLKHISIRQGTLPAIH